MEAHLDAGHLRACLHLAAPHDEVSRHAVRLCKDMQVPHKRKSNPLAELFMPYQANDYAAIFK